MNYLPSYELLKYFEGKFKIFGYIMLMKNEMRRLVIIEMKIKGESRNVEKCNRVNKKVKMKTRNYGI